MLRIENLSKIYGENKAVDNLTLHIQPGEIYGFIGHNGAGKTTTLKSVAGILQFEEGEIYINGHSIKDEPLECKKEIAYIPDNPDLYDFMTGIQYLNFIADIFDIDPETYSIDPESIEKCITNKTVSVLYFRMNIYYETFNRKKACSRREPTSRDRAASLRERVLMLLN